MKQFLYIFSFILFTYGCKNGKKQEEEVVPEVVKPEMSIAVKHKKPTSLNPDTYEKIKDWKNYTDFEKYLIRFENISPNEALSNATELKNLANELKESIKIETLKTDAFKARINVLRNEVLHLYDMTLIPSIGPKKVNQQIDKIFLIFESVNVKVNASFKDEEYHKEINLDNFFKLDSSEIRKDELKKIKPNNKKNKKSKLLNKQSLKNN